MSEYLNGFEREFLERTKEVILHEYEGISEITLLLNCSLALICLPIERNKLQEKRDEGLVGAINNKMNELGLCTKGSEEAQEGEKKDSTIRLRCLRNGICHLNNVTPENEHGNLLGFWITEGTKGAVDRKNYCCTFWLEKDKLKKFALHIAELYLSTLTR